MTLSFDSINKKIAKIKNECKTTDPYSVCDYLDINVIEAELGEDENSIKGFFCVIKRIKTIVINKNLSDNIKRVVLAHEIGHACLHKSEILGYPQAGNRHQINQSEIEANYFAAQLLLDNDDVLDMLKSGYSIQNIASINCIPEDLLIYKLKIMSESGLEFNSPLSEINSRCMNSIRKPYYSDWN